MPKKSSKTVLPDPLPNGEVLQDIAKKKWILGPSIGVGGFGEIYSAAEHSDGSKKASNYQYVIKIEPHGNGPLFCEMHFFMRNAKPDLINTWCAENKITFLGMPRYLGSGSHEHKGKKYRFLVMDKYGKDLWKIFLENKKQFPVATVYRICQQLLDVLEYIHSKGYVHADLKGANILLGLTKQTQNQVFLVDFGLASHFTKKDFKPDPKRAHNGTIEYTSRDAHEGVPTKRGDIEILAYNMVQWMGTVLPWEKNLSDPGIVHNSKKKYMEDINLFLNECFGKRKIPAPLKEFLNYVKNLDYDTEPDYKKLRTILTKGLKSEGSGVSGALEFKSTNKHKSEDSESETPEKRRRLTPKQKKTPEKPKRKKPVEIEEITDSESEIENIPVKKTRGRRKNIQESESEEEIVKPKGKKKSSPEVANGYNAEMLRIQKKIAERKMGKTKKTIKKLESSSNGNSNFDEDISERKMGKAKKTIKKSESSSNGNEDIVDDTPPQRVTIRKKRTVNTASGDSEPEVTPRTLRQKR